MSILRDLSVILLAFEAFLIALVPLILLAAVNYFAIRFRWWQVLPRYAAVGRYYLFRGQQIVMDVGKAVRAPIVAVAKAQARVAAMVDELTE